ncbi:MAG: helix-turn-helix transcriptional regulator [Agathobaculum sp.]|jgi:putative transcriptional regulator|uniref:helix-turn-helix transcriptional regulator n=1 Tax=Agathobaculum sp. TaxID=2048138 RepID=UPI003D94043F
MLHTRIRALRLSRGMEQAALAALVGVRRETIGRLEKGLYNPSLKLAMDIAHVFGLSVEEIFTFTEDEQ